jgi:hypothetical protein
MKRRSERLTKLPRRKREKRLPRAFGTCSFVLSLSRSLLSMRMLTHCTCFPILSVRFARIFMASLKTVFGSFIMSFLLWRPFFPLLPFSSPALLSLLVSSCVKLHPHCMSAPRNTIGLDRFHSRLSWNMLEATRRNVVTRCLLPSSSSPQSRGPHLPATPLLSLSFLSSPNETLFSNL